MSVALAPSRHDRPQPRGASNAECRHRLPAGAFFELREGRVAHVSNYYNLQDWLRQVGA